MRILVSTTVAAAVLSTAFVGVRLHLEVQALRYRLGSLQQARDRAERELRLAVADYEAAKAPRRLLDRWTEVQAAREAALAVGVAPPDLVRRTATPLTPVTDRPPVPAPWAEAGEASPAPVPVPAPAPEADGDEAPARGGAAR